MQSQVSTSCHWPSKSPRFVKLERLKPSTPAFIAQGYRLGHFGVGKHWTEP